MIAENKAAIEFLSCCRYNVLVCGRSSKIESKRNTVSIEDGLIERTCSKYDRKGTSRSTTKLIPALATDARVLVSESKTHRTKSTSWHNATVVDSTLDSQYDAQDLKAQQTRLTNLHARSRLGRALLFT